MIKPLIAVDTFGATNVGKVRTNNEDCFISQYIWNNQFLLCAAIDGMGGYEGGEVAADIARFTLINDLEDFQGDDVFEALKQAFVNANNEIVRHRQATPKYSSMGCVATVGLFDIIGRHLYVVHVGDSRLYRYQGGELQKLSHDHSIVGYREEIGDLTEEEAMKHPQRNVISRSVGHESHTVNDEGFLESSIYPLLADAEYLFCSDGLSDMLRSSEIREVLANDSLATEDKVNRLINDALEAGGKDNVTVVLTQVRQLHNRSANKTDNNAGGTAVVKPKKGKKIKVAVSVIIVLAVLALAALVAYKFINPVHEEDTEKEPKVLMDTNSTSIPSPESLPEIDQQIESNPEPKSEAEETTEPEQPTTDTEDTENESA
ncbi:MAG: hypothetical protein E7082_02760 [Bacteroidales bacterium]|nr:hypothetical protein [Bacteroidales bacterium]